MKSAYELAMERLQPEGPTVTLTDEQRAQLAEVDSLYQSKVAEKEVFLSDLIAKAKTGTGKTIGFLLPTIEVLSRAPPGA